MRFIDSHTGGEPTRVILEGGPDLGTGSLVTRHNRFRDEFDEYRVFAITEPRGYEALVGALLCEPEDPTCQAGVIFFNNTGYLSMCGHGTIGLAVTLFQLGRIGMGISRFETPAGIVEANLLSANRVAIENVPSYRYRQSVTLQLDPHQTVTGDIAWGGNWFFLVEDSPIEIEQENIRALSQFSAAIRAALHSAKITGEHGAEIDHVELSGPASTGADSRNFVYCPGGEYDRSPCGTGTSAKLACLAAEGTLPAGKDWIQESVTGSRFVARYRISEAGDLIPTITGDAYICAEGRLIQHPEDSLLPGPATGKFA